MDNSPSPNADRFFNQVKRQDALVEVLARHCFDPPKPYERVHNRRESLTFIKRDWILPLKESQADRITIYFESVRRGDLRLRVDLNPHRVRADIREDEVRNQEREAALKSKNSLLRDIRKRVLEDRERCGSLNITAKSLRETDRPYAMTAVKFDLNLAPDCPANEYAEAFADVIDIVSPLIDTIIKQGVGGRE